MYLMLYFICIDGCRRLTLLKKKLGMAGLSSTVDQFLRQAQHLVCSFTFIPVHDICVTHKHTYIDKMP